MPPLTAPEITKLCNDWYDAAVLSSGGISLGSNTERFRLLANDVSFPELGYDALCAAVTGLSKVLLLPGFNTVVDQDHFHLWSWCGEVLLGHRSELFPDDQIEIFTLYQTAVNAALANSRKPYITREEWHRENQIRSLQPHHAKSLVEDSALVLAYLTFPLLEAVLKRACSEFVSFDGNVVSSFEVPGRGGATIHYGPQGNRGKSRCSSLRDLLFLHVHQVAEPELSALINSFRSHITTLDNTQDPFDLVYEWRNQSLHGTTNFFTIGGLLLNFCLLISLFEVRHEFERYRQAAVASYRWDAEVGPQARRSFYPPY